MIEHNYHHCTICERNNEIVKRLEEYVDADCDCEYGGCVHSVAEKILRENNENR